MKTQLLIPLLLAALACSTLPEQPEQIDKRVERDDPEFPTVRVLRSEVGHLVFEMKNETSSAFYYWGDSATMPTASAEVLSQGVWKPTIGFVCGTGLQLWRLAPNDSIVSSATCFQDGSLARVKVGIRPEMKEEDLGGTGFWLMAVNDHHWSTLTSEPYKLGNKPMLSNGLPPEPQNR